ncbi:entericidin A/B family lipoprotein [Sphingomonas sp. LaA6.9]|nr:entericidin A/B family lipoprotein [Sphingomonas sp. LaA6.9]MCJ8159208.1 entericidin A/B family lipoprotein [Sphingomonas sp. LaA6.9]
MIRKYLAFFMVASSLLVSACNTVQGAGQDIKSVGEAGEDAID